MNRRSVASPQLVAETKPGVCSEGRTNLLRNMLETSGETSQDLLATTKSAAARRALQLLIKCESIPLPSRRSAASTAYERFLAAPRQSPLQAHATSAFPGSSRPQ
eukprot:scaffold7371_cov171-Pinguiococcus_pyrenoidosus.AAC.3